MSFRIDPRLPLTAQVRRILADEIGKALAHLAASRDRPELALHKCRKRLKKARALLRLVRTGDETFCKAENTRYRDVATLLAGPREATALVETLGRVVAAFPKRTAGGGLDAIRDAFRSRQRQQLHGGAGLGAAIDSAIAGCEEGRLRIEALFLPGAPGEAAGVLAEGARKTLRRAKKALERCGSRGRPDDFHELRKAVKTHGMHLSLLGRLWPGPVKARRKAVDALGENLGDLHDIFVMRAFIDAGGRSLGDAAAMRLLGGLLGRSEKRLKKACLAEARALFGKSPGHAIRKLDRKARRDLAAASPAEGMVSF